MAAAEEDVNIIHLESKATFISIVRPILIEIILGFRIVVVIIIVFAIIIIIIAMVVIKIIASKFAATIIGYSIIRFISILFFIIVKLAIIVIIIISTIKTEIENNFLLVWDLFTFYLKQFATTL